MSDSEHSDEVKNGDIHEESVKTDVSPNPQDENQSGNAGLQELVETENTNESVSSEPQDENKSGDANGDQDVGEKQNIESISSAADQEGAPNVGQIDEDKQENVEATATSNSQETENSEKDKDGLGQVVAKHYNELEEKGLNARTKSRIYFMRNFNNWIKSMTINEVVDKFRKSEVRELTILDMCCGKGGDILKWLKTKMTNHVVFVDIADTSVQQCKQRYDNIDDGHRNDRNHRRGRSSTFTAEFHTADCTKQRLRSIYKNPDIKFDLVSVQFSFHYCFESLPQAQMMLRNISENLKPGGYFIGTTTNADRIVYVDIATRYGDSSVQNSLKTTHFEAVENVCSYFRIAGFGLACAENPYMYFPISGFEKKIRKSGGKEFGNDIYRIVVESSEPFPIFGAKFYFQLDEVVNNCPEFLVNFPALVKLAEKFGLKLVFKHTFDKYFQVKLQDGHFLLDRMHALETYPAFDDESLSSEKEEDYIHAKKFKEDTPDCRRFGTLSKSEWEAVSLYTAFAFEKVEKVE